jgi:TonB-linked SusC/RagA family outer membrane protein
MRRAKNNATFIAIICLLVIFPVEQGFSYTLQAQQKKQDSQKSHKPLSVVGNIKQVQQPKISLNVDEEPLLTVLKDIARKVHVGLSYQKELIPDKKVTAHLKEVPVYQALRGILKGTGLKVVLPASKDVLVIKKRQLKMKTRQMTVKGKVTDAKSGDALIGANILIKGTQTGTQTNKQGHYELSVPSPTDTILVSYIGYKTRNIPIKGRSEIDVKLKSTVTKGKQLVVTAFGQKQESQDVVGAVTSVSNNTLKKISESPTSNLTATLAGRVPGIIGFQRGGAPGANNAKFFVRGVTTFGYDKSPLILIDGVKSTTNDLANLNPNDIASFSILKDATATSLYGSEAANGVLLIKTKEGHEGKVNVDVRVATNLSEPTQVPKLANAITYMKDADQASLTRAPLEPIPYSQRKIDKTQEPGSNPYLYPAVNYRKRMFKNHAINQKYSLNVNGGGSIATYYISGSYNDSKGLFRVPQLNNFNSNIDFKNYSLRSNINVNLTKSTEVAVKLSGDFTNYNGPTESGGAVYNQLMDANPVRFPPVYPTSSDTSFANTEQPLFGMDEQGDVNPYAEMVDGYEKRHRAKINTQFRIDQDLSSLVKGVELKGLVNIQRYAKTSVDRSYSPYYYEAAPITTGPNAYNSYVLRLLNPDGGTNSLSYKPQAKTVTSNFFAQAQASYQHTFGEKEGVSALLVFNARNQTYDNAGNLQASLPHRNVNLAGRLTYNFNHIYYAEFNFGYNASERFSKNNRWGFFPSVGVSWNISNQKFWKPIKSILNTFKIRATYGYSGNDAIGNNDHRFFYLSVVNPDASGNSFTFGIDRANSHNGIFLNRYANPFVTWENAKKLNLGIHLRILNQLDFKANLFYQDRTNILQTRNDLPSALGLASTPSANIGEVKSHGIDSHIRYTARFGKDWFLQVRGNFTFGTNKYVKYSETYHPNSPNVSHIGQPVGEVFGLYADHLFIDKNEVKNAPKQEYGAYGAGDIRYRDVNGDGVITDLDKVPLGFPIQPEITYGFGFTASFKDVDLSAFFEGLARESFWIDAAGTSPYVGGHQLLKAYANNHWTTKNRNLTALFPRFSTNDVTKGYDNNTQTSSWFMRNGAFLRVKEIQVGYSLPQQLASSLSLKKVRIYVNGRNLFHFSHFKLWDPEMGGKGLGYPLQRQFNIGINIKF